MLFPCSTCQVVLSYERGTPVPLGAWRGLTLGEVPSSPAQGERERVVDNPLVRIHFIIVMIWWTGLAPWEFEYPFPGSLICTFLESM